MDFKYPPEAETFRQEIRAWLEVNAPKDEHPPYDTITVANDARMAGAQGLVSQAPFRRLGRHKLAARLRRTRRRL